MRVLLKLPGPAQHVSADSFKQLEAHAKAARMLQKAAAAQLPYKDAISPTVPEGAPYSVEASRQVNELMSWRRERAAAESGLKKALASSTNLLKKLSTPEAATQD